MIHAYVGEKISLFVTSTTDRPSCLTLPEKNLFMAAQQGEISEGEVLFDRPGTYRIFCPAGKISGKFIVREHPKSRRERVRRRLASEKKVKIWRPKDE